MKNLRFCLILILLSSCGLTAKQSSSLTHRKITSVEKYSMVTVEGSRFKYMIPSDTIKVNDMIPVVFRKE